MSVTGLSDLQFSTKEDPFWSSVGFDQLEDEEFILDQYYKLQQSVEAGSNEENEARLKDVFENDSDALLAEMGLKKDLALPLEVISSGIRPTIFDVQIKRRAKIVERICVALSRVHESSSIKPKIVEFQRRENTISLQKLISGKLNTEAIKAFLTHVDSHGIFSLLHHKQQPLNRLQEKFVELVDNKHEPKDRYSRMQAITGLIALAVSRASLKDMIASIKSILVEQNRAEDEMQSSSISPSVVAMHYLTKLVKYRKYKELSAMTTESDTWNIELRAGVVLGMCSDGKYLFVAYKDASSISIVKYGTGLYGTERTVTLRSRTVSSNSRVWLALVGKKLHLMIQNNASLISVVDTKDMREDASINLNHVKKDAAHIVFKRSTALNNNNQRLDSPNTNEVAANTAPTTTNAPPPPPPPPQANTPATPVQPQPTITCSPITSDGRFLYQLCVVPEADLERVQMSDSQESKSAAAKTDSPKLVCLDVYDPYQNMTLLSRIALSPPGNPVRQSERVCEGCGRVNMDLRAYQCKSCYNYVLCSACYTSGHSSKTHNASHVMDPIKESLSIDNSVQKLPFTNDALTRGTLYVTGHQLAIVIPPKVLPNNLKDRYLCRIFNIEDGAYIADVQTGIGELAGVFACYDTASDTIWSLATSNNVHRVTNWPNLGLGNQQFSALQPITQLTLESVSAEALLSHADYALSNIYDEKAQISLERACYILLYHVDLFARRLSEKNGVHKTQSKSAEYAVSMREHFCLQASKEVFVQLNALLTLCIELYRTKTTPLFKYALLVTLRTLRLNMEHVLMSKMELGEFGLGKEGSLARGIKDRLLELLATPLSSELDHTVWQHVQTESAQLLLTGLDVFYNTHEDKARLLLSLLRGEFKCSAHTELLDSLLAVLITHEETFSVLNYKSSGREVFKQLLEHSAHDTQQQLHALEVMAQDKENTHRLFSVESKSSRVNSLLFYYQNLLLGRAMNDKRHEPLVLQYLAELVQCSGVLMTGVSEIYHRAVQHVSEESVEYSQYTDLIYHLAFKHSLLGSLVPNGLLGLRALQLRGILTVTDETMHALLAPCAQLAAVLDKFNSQVPRVLLEERNRLYKRHTLNLYKAKYVESTHPYLEYANKEVLVNIPKSIHMKVEFDDKCSTENQFDYLQLCVRRPDNPNVLEPISEQYWGRGQESNWPKGQLTVPGHTVIFLFHTEGGWTTNMMRNMGEEQSEALVARRYGFRCKVKGLVKTKPFFIINSLYLHKTLAWFVTVNLADMMRAPYLSASEQALTALLDSSAVFENVDVQEMRDAEHGTFLHQLVAQQGAARLLHDTLLASLRSQVLPLTTDCQAVVDHALRSVLAVLLKYSGALLNSAVLVSQQLMQNTTPDPQALAALKALWRYIYVQQMRPWLTTTAQNMKKRADQSSAAMTILAAYAQLSAQLTALAEVLLHVTAPSSVSHEQLWSEVLRVFRQLPAATTLTALVHKRQHAAQLRARALRDMHALFMNMSLISVKQDVLSFFTPVFKQLGGHYAAGLKGCGDQYLQLLRESFEQLFTHLLHSLQHANNNYYRLLVLDFFVQHYRTEDLPLLHSSHFFEHLLQACERSASTVSTEDVHLKTKALHLDAAQLPNSFTSKYGNVCQQLIGSTTDLESTLKSQRVEYQLSEQYSPEYALLMWLYPHSYAEVQNSAGQSRCVVHKPTSDGEGLISVQLNSSFYVTFTAATATGVKTLKSVQPLTLAEWNHVMCVCMPHRLVLYINGVLDNELLLADADTPVFTAQTFTLNTMSTGAHTDADPSLACHAAQTHLVLSALYDEDADLLARQPPLPPDVAQKEREDAKKYRATARALLWSLGTQQHAPAAAQSALATLLRRRLDAPLRPSKLRVLAAMVRGYAETVHGESLSELVALTAQLMSRPLPPRLYRTALALAARILTDPQYDHHATQSPFVTPIALINRLGVALRITMAIGPRLAAQTPLSFEAPTTQAVLVLHYWAGLEPENFASLLQKHATKIYPSKPGVYSPLSRLGEVARETQELGKSVLRMGTLDECWSLGAYLSRFGFTLSIELHPSNPSLQAQLSIKERMQSAHKSEVVSKLDQFCRPGLGADSMYGHAGALVHLVRGMMRVSATQPVINEFLVSAVALIPRLMQLDEIRLDDSMTQSIVDGVLSSLAIMGGWNELHLRPGALVDVKLEQGKKRAHVGALSTHWQPGCRGVRGQSRDHCCRHLAVGARAAGTL